MENVSRGLASLGRYGDNNLVHVSDRELRGIEGLTGRKFTRNPDTGLPEAFSFMDILPMIAGVGATVATGGAAAPLVGALAAGGTKAGIGLAKGDDISSALTQGVITGLTSYAGGQVLQGLGAAGNLAEGVGAAAGGAGEAAATAVPSVAPVADAAVQGASGAGAFTPNFGADGTVLNAPASWGNPSPTGAPMQGPTLTPQDAAFNTAVANNTPFGSLDAAAAKGATTAYANQPFSERMSDLGRAVRSPETMWETVKQYPMSTIGAVGGTVAGAMDMFGNNSDPSAPKKSSYVAPPFLPGMHRTPVMPGAGYQPGVNPEHRYFAAGGVASLDGGDMPSHKATMGLVDEATAALLGEHPNPQSAIKRFVDRFGEHALQRLMANVQAQSQGGGQVRGAGGGLDDLVPGSIEGREDVRLADGEFVVPSDVVSGLGDGSTNQGVKKLHQMMDRVRMSKGGSTTQPGRVSDRVLPA